MNVFYLAMNYSYYVDVVQINVFVRTLHERFILSTYAKNTEFILSTNAVDMFATNSLILFDFETLFPILDSVTLFLSDDFSGFSSWCSLPFYLYRQFSTLLISHCASLRITAITLLQYITNIANSLNSAIANIIHLI